MPQNVFIVVPAFGQTLTAATFMTVCGLQGALAQKAIGARVTTFSFPDIAELRSIFTTIWHDTMPDTEMMLWVDADMAFTPDLVLDMILFGEPLVGTLYRQRNPDITWAGSGTGESQTERRGGFVKVEGVGFGCTLVRRQVVSQMVAAYPELIDTRLSMHPANQLLRNAGVTRLIRCFEKMDIPDRGVVSEDLSFCIRWNKIGGQVWANIAHPISHVGPFDYRGCYGEHVAQMEAQKQIEQENLKRIIAQAQPVAEPPPEMRIAAE